MRKLIPFLSIASIILLLVVGMSACGKAATSTQPPVEQVAPAPETVPSNLPETPPSTPTPTQTPSLLPKLTLNEPLIDGLKVTINGVTIPGTQGATIMRIHWDWGDGLSEDQWFPASHNYKAGGLYAVKVTSYQSDGLSTMKSIMVQVIGKVPTPAPTPPSVGVQVVLAELFAGDW